MQQQPIYVPNGEFWEKFEELGDRTYRQAVTLDETLFEHLKDSADEARRIGGEYDYLLSWNQKPKALLFSDQKETPQRTIVLVGEQRKNGLYLKAVMISIQKLFLGFRHPEHDSKIEFLFVAED